MADPIKCQTTDRGAPCAGEARWWVTGPNVTPHACCDGCKESWVSQGATANPLRGSVLDKAARRARRPTGESGRGL